MYQCWVPELALVCMFTTLQNLHHHVRTLYGDSEVWGSTEIWGVPVSGIGQDNGAGPQIWAMVSTPILDLLWQVGYGAAFKAGITNNNISFVRYSFVDDTDLIQTALNIDSTCKDTIPLMQAALDIWSTRLQITGTTKSFWYAIDFRWSAGKWTYAKPKPNYKLQMWDHKNTWHTLQLLGPMEVQCTLGEHLAPDGNKKHKLTYSLKKTIHGLTKPKQVIWVTPWPG